MTEFSDPHRLYLVNFGQRIKMLRENKRWTQKRLGKAIGTSQWGIYKYEKGAVEPGVYVAYKLAQELGCTADELLGLEDC